MVCLNMKGFSPENLHIKTTKDNYLQIEAKKEQESANSYYLSELCQSYKLPDDLNLKDLKILLLNYT